MDRDSPRKRRRGVLGALAAGTLAVAGCLTTENTPSAKPDDETETEKQGQKQTPEPSPTPKSMPDGPTPIEVPAAPGDCPGYGEAEPVVCYDGVAGQESAFPAYLESFSPGESVSFTLHNTSEQALNTNFYDWRVHKEVDGEWYSVAPQFVNQPLMRVSPGEEHAWTVTVDNSGIESGEAVQRVSATEDIDIAGLGGGHYAFRARGWFDSQDHERDAVFAATVELDAPSLGLTPTNAVQVTERDSETLIADSKRGDPDDEDVRQGAFVLERVDDVEPDRRVIIEQVLRRSRLRDTVALALDSGATTVRLVEYDGTRPLFGLREPYSFTHQGETFRVSTETLSDEE